MTSIQAIIVLYKMAFAESPSGVALLKFQADLSSGETPMALMVADNSPDPQKLPANFTGVYLHDGLNPGLARRYNQALDRAVRTNATWLLLLDQDTQITEEYLSELMELAQSMATREEVAIIAPKLVMHDRILSPHRRPFRGKPYVVEPERTGLLPQWTFIFNSGSLLRVSALQKIGGFPEDYWLDYLDHATAHRIQSEGGRVFVMRASIEHELAEQRRDQPINEVRLANKLKAQARFYAEYGTLWEHCMNRIDLLRQVVGHGRRGRIREAKIRLNVLLNR